MGGGEVGERDDDINGVAPEPPQVRHDLLELKVGGLFGEKLCSDATLRQLLEHRTPKGGFPDWRRRFLPVGSACGIDD